jgi:hypothetical protein
VLARLVAEPGAVAAVARRTLAMIHLAVDGAALPADVAALVDEPGTSCVAGCYRCILSYYNQPDHERIDRRDEATRTLLLRLARAATRDTSTGRATAPPAGSTPEAPRRRFAGASEPSHAGSLYPTPPP